MQHDFIAAILNQKAAVFEIAKRLRRPEMRKALESAYKIARPKVEHILNKTTEEMSEDERIAIATFSSLALAIQLSGGLVFDPQTGKMAFPPS